MNQMKLHRSGLFVVVAELVFNKVMSIIFMSLYLCNAIYYRPTRRDSLPFIPQKNQKKLAFFFIFVLSSFLCEVQLMNQKRGLILISLRHLLFITILRNIKEVNEIMRFLYPKYRRNRLTAQHAGGGYNDQSNYC